MDGKIRMVLARGGKIIFQDVEIFLMELKMWIYERVSRKIEENLRQKFKFLNFRKGWPQNWGKFKTKNLNFWIFEEVGRKNEESFIRKS